MAKRSKRRGGRTARLASVAQKFRRSPLFGIPARVYSRDFGRKYVKRRTALHEYNKRVVDSLRNQARPRRARTRFAPSWLGQYFAIEKGGYKRKAASRRMQGRFKFSKYPRRY